MVHACMVYFFWVSMFFKWVSEFGVVIYTLVIYKLHILEHSSRVKYIFH